MKYKLVRDLLLILLFTFLLTILLSIRSSIKDERTAKVPIIFIHGAGGYPEDWEERDIYTQFKNGDFDQSLLWKFSYGYDDGKYNNLGDPRVIANKLMRDIETLSERSVSKGGDERVNIVTFSYGGVVADYYLKQNIEDELGTIYKDNIDKVLFIAAPHNGLQLLSALDEAREIPLLATFLDRSITLVVGEETQSSYALDIIHPDSEYMKTQSQKPYPDNVQISNLYVDTYTTFSLTNDREEELDSYKQWFGDLVVLEEDAIIYGKNVNNIEKTYEATVILPDDLIDLTGVSSKSLKETLPASFHLNLLTEPDDFGISGIAWDLFARQ